MSQVGRWLTRAWALYFFFLCPRDGTLTHGIHIANSLRGSPSRNFQGSRRFHWSSTNCLCITHKSGAQKAAWSVHEKSGTLPTVAHSLDTRPVLLVLKQLPMPQLSYSRSLGRHELRRGEMVKRPRKVVTSPCGGFLRDPLAMSTCTSLAKAGLHMLPRLTEAG